MGHPYKSRPVGNTVNWVTPRSFFILLGEFDLDPCACDPMPWKTAKTMWTEKGLEKDWFGRVWLNPPYGKETALWLRKMSEHQNGIALVFARTETDMFKKYVWYCADSIMFMYGRPSFYHPDGRKAKGNSGGPMVLISYSKTDTNCLRRSFIPGKLISIRSSDAKGG